MLTCWQLHPAGQNSMEFEHNTNVWNGFGNIFQTFRSHGVSWWRHQMETFSALLAHYAGNSPVAGEFPSRTFDVFFDLRLNKRSGKQSWGWWFETPSRSLWRHYNVPLTEWKHLVANMCWSLLWLHVDAVVMKYQGISILNAELIPCVPNRWDKNSQF